MVEVAAPWFPAQSTTTFRPIGISPPRDRWTPPSSRLAADTAIEASSAWTWGTFTVRTPRRRLHQPGRHQVEAVEEPFDLAAAAQHQRGGRLLVDPGDLGCLVGMEVGGGVGEHQEAARRDRVAEPGDD